MEAGAKAPVTAMARNRPPRAQQDTAIAEPLALPVSVRLLRPHGFIDETGTQRYWRQGLVVSHPADVAVLIARGAHFATEV